jgi:hypothetical protein
MHLVLRDYAGIRNCAVSKTRRLGETAARGTRTEGKRHRYQTTYSRRFAKTFFRQHKLSVSRRESSIEKIYNCQLCRLKCEQSTPAVDCRALYLAKADCL